MHVIFSIDVEEEGLFSGAYPRRPPGVASAGELRRRHLRLCALEGGKVDGVTERRAYEIDWQNKLAGPVVGMFLVSMGMRREIEIKAKITPQTQEIVDATASQRLFPSASI